MREFVRSSLRYPYAAWHCIDASTDINASANACNIAPARS